MVIRLSQLELEQDLSQNGYGGNATQRKQHKHKHQMRIDVFVFAFPSNYWYSLTLDFDDSGLPTPGSPTPRLSIYESTCAFPSSRLPRARAPIRTFAWLPAGGP